MRASNRVSPDLIGVQANDVTALDGGHRTTSPLEMLGLSYLREPLPDQEPIHAWSHLEFIAEDGSINEVDVLVVSLPKISLVEINS